MAPHDRDDHIQPHQIEVIRTARYFQIGTPGPDIHTYWLACHGYGQQAQYFIRKFRSLGPGHLIVAPEGLSRFYVKGLSGAVGASWMTTEDRLQEIEDYARYLTQLHDQVRHQLSPTVRILLVGFSQGCATLVRWIVRQQPDFHRLVLWGGLLPEDINYAVDAPPSLQQGRIEVVFGEQDVFLTPARLAQQREMIQKYRLLVREHTFEGGHTVDSEALLRLYQQYWAG